MQSSTSRRLLYLDFVRGAAALTMLQGHVFHSFLKNDLRQGGTYILSQFLGGMPPAVFLFLTGVTLAFLMDGRERQGLPAGARVWAATRRSGYLLGVAFLFRLQLWLFGWPASPWQELFKVDILNCMGFAVAVMSLMAVFRTGERVRLCAILGLAIAAASPLVSQIDWAGVPPVVAHYIAPDFNHFSFFPWASYLVFGISAGSLIRTVPDEHMDRTMQWSAILGGAMVLACQFFANLPYSIYAKSDFWLNSPAQVLSKLGVILLILPFAFLWTRYGANHGWSWVRQFGTTSLLVYWVHIELVYGRWLYFWKENLDLTQTVGAAVLVILMMLGISVLRTKRDLWRSVIATLPWYPSVPKRVPGD
jgi:heparan-alpha-glucosaminide N-acetyltransferase-like protein